MDYPGKTKSIIQEIKKQGIEALCFWFPSYGMGGGALAFYRMAVWLRHHTPLPIYYVDYKDGYFAPMLREQGVWVIGYDDAATAFTLKKRCVVITNSTRAILLQQMRPDNKLLFWHWETVDCAWDSLFLLQETQAFFQLCNEKRAMVFHDWSSWDALSQAAGFAFDKAYLPVFIEPVGIECPPDLVDDEEIHLAWLGRLVPDKIQSLFYIMDNLWNYPSEKRKVLHIIGDGRSRSAVENYCTRFRSKIAFDFKGTLTGGELDRFLAENADVVFAMGTSALEGAAMKIPSAVVLLNMAKIASDEFFWLFESKEHCCGVMCAQKKRFAVEYSHFRDMLDDIYLYGMKEEYGERSYRYYVQNHAGAQYTCHLLLEAVKDCRLTMEDLGQCIKYIPYHHLLVRHRKFLGRSISDKIDWVEDGCRH